MVPLLNHCFQSRKQNASLLQENFVRMSAEECLFSGGAVMSGCSVASTRVPGCRVSGKPCIYVPLKNSGLKSKKDKNKPGNGK